MSEDFELDEITEIFLEESQEGLDTMETGLLGLEEGNADAEIMNDIFRAAHSIKGGAGTFGFMDVSSFTHGVETLLDEMRSGDRAVTPDGVQLLLKSVDRLREMMHEIQTAGKVDVSLNEDLEKEINRLLETGSSADQTQDASQAESAAGKDEDFNLIDVQQVKGAAALEEEVTHWQIEFTPHLNMLQKGNDPVRIFKELEKIGELEVEAITDHIPPPARLVADNCYLSWKVRLTGNISEEQIYDIFDWALEDCDLAIQEVLEWAPTTKSHQASKHEPGQTDSRQPAAQAEVQGPVNKDVEKQPRIKPSADSASKHKKDNAVSAKKPAPVKAATKESSSIRVSIEKVDALLNLVGELVITQSMLKQFGAKIESEGLKELSEGLIQLERYTRELQENVMDIRMLPISFTFNRFPRLVHDISRKLGKKVELIVAGEQTELDKTVLEKIGDPLVHLVRNSLDHGIEMPAVRVASGKPEQGTLTLSASQEGGNIVIRVIDDGAGINKEKLLAKAIQRNIVSADDHLTDERINALIFHPGFSSVDEVTDLSGRGVGMDVVRNNIKDLNGRVEVHSETNIGTTLTIRLPLTLAILDGQLVRVGEETYIISLLSIIETVLIKKQEINHVVGQAEVYPMRGEYIPIIWLGETLQAQPEKPNQDEGLLVVVEADGRRVGLFVDELLDQQQVVIKSLEDNFKQVDGVSGATILGDGTVALILDIPGLFNAHLSRRKSILPSDKHAA